MPAARPSALPAGRPEAWPAAASSPDEPSEEDQLREAFGRALGFTIAAFVLLVGGGIFVIVVAAIFFGFLYGS